jgi:hypothetical protein
MPDLFYYLFVIYFFTAYSTDLLHCTGKSECCTQIFFSYIQYALLFLLHILALTDLNVNARLDN